MHEGHRQRMFEKIKRAEESFQDHELLEVLLYNVIPRKNTNETAHMLLTTFGSLRGVLSAGYDELRLVEGVGESTAAYLRCLGATMRRTEEEKGKPLPQITNGEEFERFLRERFDGAATERIELYGVNVKGEITFVKELTSDEAERVRIASEEVGKILSTYRPYGLFAAHNHVRGRSDPSEADDRFTKQLHMMCAMNNVKLYDHAIVGQRDIYSYYQSGALTRIREKYSVEEFLNR